ncbi:hypothetical protein DM860_012491 [Cuscuta australis]|uniref:Polymerase nucleotidyl transferase domain-containing protein n=1 Tax=Cuscuta australis TaxID=267555 RepID=A0A328DDN6_9ASTE|nr:hypothetical protein DM860_012491 [Cuscuta australis]
MGYRGDGGGHGGSGGPRVDDRLAATHPDPSSIGEECWAAAEETAKELVNCIHPTMDSEEKRKDVMEYVQKLIRDYLACEAFPYGSVPLKTYLPDGDIDLTALTSPNAEESLAHDVLALLRAEEQNGNAEYEVKDTQFIDAEVKLVKCLVQNVVIDISFNQLGGLCTLCFLEQVDRLVGKNHLFKRSIMVIKSWCYYESRILGAHHGLISTYALEALVLYIFQFFHSSLNGPLAVLYRFLDYYSKFDWENYCVSLNGPVSKASLPEIVVYKLDNGMDDALLSEEFLRNCMEMFSVPSRLNESGSLCPFKLKHLNIIDPLKENNNLGRSVHRGNYYRIRSAFKYGVRKLGRILSSPHDKIGDGIKKFFVNTIDMHGHNHLNSLKNSSPLKFCPKSSEPLSYEDEMPLKPLSVYCNDNYKNFECEDKWGSSILRNGVDNLMMKQVSENSCFATGDWAPTNSTDWGPTQSWEFDCLNGKTFFGPWIEQGEVPLDHVTDYSDSVCSGDSAISTPKASSILESLPLDFRERDLASIAGDDLEFLNPLADLTGDYDSHIRSLVYGQCCHGYASMTSLLPDPLFAQSQFQDSFQYSTIFRQDSFTNTSSMFVGPTFIPSPANNPLPSNGTCHEEKPKLSIAKPFIPTMDRSCKVKGGGNKELCSKIQFQKGTSSNGWIPVLSEANGWGNDDFKQDFSLHSQTSCKKYEKLSSSNQYHYHHSGYSSVDENSLPNSLSEIEFGSLGKLCDTSLSVPTSRYDKPSGGKQMWCRKERFADQSFRLKNEDEFPPLTPM